MDTKKRICKIIIVTIMFLSILMPVVFAKGFNHIAHGDPHQRTTPFTTFQPDGKHTTVFCKQYKATVGLGNVRAGETRSSKPSGTDYRYNASQYTCVSTHDLPKFWAYLLTEDKDVALTEMTWEQKRQIQIALWCEGNFNEGVNFATDPDAYQAMQSYEVLTEIQKQSARAAKIVEYADLVEEIMNDHKDYLSGKFKFDTRQYPWSKWTISEIRQKVIYPHIQDIKTTMLDEANNLSEQLENGVEAHKYDDDIDNLRKLKQQELNVALYEEDVENINGYYNEQIETMRGVNDSLETLEDQIKAYIENALYLAGDDEGLKDEDGNDLDLKDKVGINNVKKSFLDQYYSDNIRNH